MYALISFRHSRPFLDRLTQATPTKRVPTASHSSRSSQSASVSPIHVTFAQMPTLRGLAHRSLSWASQSVTTTSGSAAVRGGAVGKAHAVGTPVLRTSSTTSPLDKGCSSPVNSTLCTRLLVCIALRAARDLKVKGESCAILDILHALWSTLEHRVRRVQGLVSVLRRHSVHGTYKA
jgi:hypothetical protein